MSRTVSPRALQAMLSRETGEVFLICLSIAPPTGSTAFAPILLVNDNQPLVRADGTYQPFPFEVTLPDDTDERIPQVAITIDMIDRSVIEQIRTVIGLPQVSFFVVLASQPNTIEVGPFQFSLLDAEYDVLTIRGTLGYEEDFLDQAIPGDVYTPTNSPALFAS